MRSSDDEKSRPRKQIDELRGAVEGHQLALSVARETNEELRTSVVLARAQSDALRVDLELREDEVAALRTEHRAALAQAKQAEVEVAEARAAIATLETTLAGRERDVTSRDAHVAIAERGIEERDQQISTLRKQLDQSNEQFALFEGEIQTQRAVLESARHAIALRDDRIAYLQDAMRNVEQVARGTAKIEALPRPQVGMAPAASPAPTPLAESIPIPVAVPTAAAVPAPNIVPPKPKETLPTPIDAAEQSANTDSESAIAPESVAPAQAEEPVEVVTEPNPEDAIDSKAPDVVADVAQPSQADASQGTPSEQPAPPSPAKLEVAPESDAADPFFYRDVPPLITPVLRYWRDAEIGKSHPDEAVTSVDRLFFNYVAAGCEARPDDTLHIWSLGGGDTQVEVRIAALLKEKQFDNFIFHILDSQPKKLKKQRTMIVSGLELKSRFDVHEGELENWPADSPCDFVIADGSISSAKDPEGLLDRIRKVCENGAVLLMTDRIGSSSPLSPAAIGAISGIFGGLSEKQRKNKIEGSVEAEFTDRRESQDDSTTGRLMALLEERFQFELEFTGGNLIEALVGPEFGPNFKTKEPDDCKLIDQLASLDQGVISSESLAPRYLVAVLRTDPVAAPLVLGCASTDPSGS